ncbi:hypothetical protein HDU79_005950, partial [Rhizoclosmatium sp. JEL0117]
LDSVENQSLRTMPLQISMAQPYISSTMTSYETLPDMANVSISKTRISSIAVADSFRIVPKAMNSEDGANNPVQIKPATQIVPEIIDAAKRNGFWTDTSTNPIVIHSADAYFIQDTGGIDSANTLSSQANGLQPQMEQVNQKFYSKKAEIPITNIESGSFGRVFADSHDAGNGSGPVTVQVHRQRPTQPICQSSAFNVDSSDNRSSFTSNFSQRPQNQAQSLRMQQIIPLSNDLSQAVQRSFPPWRDPPVLSVPSPWNPIADTFHSQPTKS